MPSLCFPSPGSDADTAGSVVMASAANSVPRPYNSGGYAGAIDPAAARQLQLEAESGNGAALFAAEREQDRGGLLLLLALAAGVYLLSDNR